MSATIYKSEWPLWLRQYDSYTRLVMPVGGGGAETVGVSEGRGLQHDVLRLEVPEGRWTQTPVFLHVQSRSCDFVSRGSGKGR